MESPVSDKISINNLLKELTKHEKVYEDLKDKYDTQTKLIRNVEEKIIENIIQQYRLKPLPCCSKIHPHYKLPNNKFVMLHNYTSNHEYWTEKIKFLEENYEHQ